MSILSHPNVTTYSGREQHMHSKLSRQMLYPSKKPIWRGTKHTTDIFNKFFTKPPEQPLSPLPPVRKSPPMTTKEVALSKPSLATGYLALFQLALTKQALDNGCTQKCRGKMTNGSSSSLVTEFVKTNRLTWDRKTHITNNIVFSTSKDTEHPTLNHSLLMTWLS